MARLVTIREQVINGKRFPAAASVGEVDAAGVITPVAEVTVGDMQARLRRRLVVVGDAVTEKKGAGADAPGQHGGGETGKKAKK